MGTRAALIIIDLQVGYMAEAAGTGDVVQTIQALRAKAKATGVPVVFIQHEESGFGPGDLGWEIAFPVSVDETVVRKRSADSFLDTDLEERLHALGVKSIVVTGYSTEYCVDSTARSALSLGFDVVIVADGHMTSVSTDGSSALTADQVVRHHNNIFGTITYAGRSCTVVPASELTF
ncbi:hypothetical protein BFN03_16245 [Rhodococcus sp. WMMA185]|nr:hypothetical protein BFN03_16245 [Rhodococcus sp. WMMA185]